MPADYPPAPWTLRGRAIALLHLVPLEAARPSLPPGVKVVEVWPGRTLGGVLYATYDERSTLAYRELIVFCGLARVGWKIGAWISHIYVDDPRSVAGGREIWGLPKELAEFRFTEGVDQTVCNDRSILRMATRCGRIKLPVPLWMPAWGCENGRLLRFAGRGFGMAGLGIAQIEVTTDTPFSGPVPEGARLGVCLKGLRVTVPAPRGISRTG